MMPGWAWFVTGALVGLVVMTVFARLVWIPAACQVFLDRVLYRLATDHEARNWTVVDLLARRQTDQRGAINR